MTTLNPIFHIKLGTPDHPCVYIEESPGVWHEFEAYEYFYVKKKMNNTSEFEVKFYDIKDAEKLYLKRNANIMFFMGSTKILKGIIRVVKYTSGYECEVNGYCNSVKLMDKDFIKGGAHRVDYDDTSAQTVANEILSTNSDGSTPWDMTPDTEGLFATDHGKVFTRFEYSNKLQCLAKLVEGIEYEWEVEQDEDDYSEDIFKIKEYLPSSTRAMNTQGTFVVGGDTENCEKTSLEVDTQNMANKITVLGYGDGENQLTTSTYSASTVNSVLDIDLTETTTTIDLIDASDFASSGTARIGEEQFSWISKFGNSLVGCTRGVNSTTATKHLRGNYIEKYVDIDSAETDSSIEEYGIISSTYIDRSILSYETLELIASKKLLEKMNPIVTIKILPEDIVTAAETYKIGDLITINDSESSIDDDYRIVGIDYTSEYGMLSIEITASTSEVTFTTQSQKDKDEAESLQKYMQGSTNIYAINESENCDSSFPLNMRFYVPDDAIAINKVNLNLKTGKYRADSKSITGAPVSQVNSSIWCASDHASWHFDTDFITTTTNSVAYGLGTTSSLVTATNPGQSADDTWYVPYSLFGSSVLDWVYSSADPVTSISDLNVSDGGYMIDDFSSLSGRFLLADSYGYTSAVTSYSTINNVPSVDTGEMTRGYWVSDTANPTVDIGYITAPNLTGTFDAIRASFSYYHGTQTSRSITFTLERSANGSTGWATVDTWNDTLASGDTFNGEVEESTDYRGYYYRLNIAGSYANDLINISTCSLNVGTYIATALDLDYGIFEETFPAGTPKVEIEVGLEGSEAGVTGSPITITDGGATEIDITDEVLDVGAGNWINIKFTPQDGTDHNLIRIEANAYIKLFIHSET